MFPPCSAAVRVPPALCERGEWFMLEPWCKLLFPG